jgi:hypothetical protein
MTVQNSARQEDSRMGRTLRNRVVATALAGATLTLVAGPAAAVTPTTETSSAHVERPLLDCPDFTVLGVWEISHRLTFFYDSAGVATRDIEQVDFRGRLVNESTGTWVADSGARTYFDTLAPDGSYLTTYRVEVRTSKYVHTAGRTDFQTGEFRGVDGFAPTNIAALCEALGA